MHVGDYIFMYTLHCCVVSLIKTGTGSGLNFRLLIDSIFFLHKRFWQASNLMCKCLEIYLSTIQVRSYLDIHVKAKFSAYDNNSNNDLTKCPAIINLTGTLYKFSTMS